MGLKDYTNGKSSVGNSKTSEPRLLKPFSRKLSTNIRVLLTSSGLASTRKRIYSRFDVVMTSFEKSIDYLAFTELASGLREYSEAGIGDSEKKTQ